MRSEVADPQLRARLEKHSRRGHDEDDWVSVALGEMSTIRVLIDNNANCTFMSDEDSSRMQLAYDKFLVCYTKL